MTDDAAWPLARRVCRTGYADLPASAVESARRDILDTLGCMLGGIEEIGVGKCRPAHLPGWIDVVIGEDAAHAGRSVVVEENLHPRDGDPSLPKRRTPLMRSSGRLSKISVAICSTV